MRKGDDAAAGLRGDRRCESISKWSFINDSSRNILFVAVLTAE
jgi:hypothetical protein